MQGIRPLASYFRLAGSKGLQPHLDPPGGHIGLGLRHGVFAEVEDARCQDGVGFALREDFDHVVERARTAEGGDVAVILVGARRIRRQGPVVGHLRAAVVVLDILDQLQLRGVVGVDDGVVVFNVFLGFE